MKGANMRYRQILICALGFLLGAASNLLADGPTFTAIDFPGATSTQAWGITLSGDIVGFYVSADKATHGFLKSRGQFISIDFPGAAFTEVNGMSPQGDIGGDIVGGYPSPGVSHGFLLSDGQYTTVDAVPGATFTNVTAIDSRGEMVGR